MDQKVAEEWYIDDHDQRKGPFSAKQISELFEKGELSAACHISNKDKSKSLKIVNFLESRVDTTHSLFQTLQISKEKGYHSHHSHSSHQDPDMPFESGEVYEVIHLPTKKKKSNLSILLITLLTLGILVGILAIMRLLMTPKETPSKPDSSTLKTETSPHKTGLEATLPLQKLAQPKFPTRYSSPLKPSPTPEIPPPAPLVNDEQLPTSSNDDGMMNNEVASDPADLPQVDAPGPKELDNSLNTLPDPSQTTTTQPIIMPPITE